MSTKNTEAYIDEIKEKMAPFGDVVFKKMFGSMGLFLDGVSFGGIMENTFRLKVGDANRADYEAHGMEGWQVPGKKMVMSYYEVPASVLANEKLLMEWAGKALEVAIAAKKKKKK